MYIVFSRLGYCFDIYRQPSHLVFRIPICSRGYVPPSHYQNLVEAPEVLTASRPDTPQRAWPSLSTCLCYTYCGSKRYTVCHLWNQSVHSKWPVFAPNSLCLKNSSEPWCLRHIYPTSLHILFRIIIILRGLEPHRCSCLTVRGA